MSSVRGRVVAALGAGAFGQGVNVAIQLLSLPAFLAVWTPAEYGVWLMLSAFTAYLSMADVGLVTAVGNEMTMATGRGDAPEANRLFQSALAFMLLVCGTVGLLSLAAAAFAPVRELDTGDRRLALGALMLTAVLALFGGLCDAVFRATGRYAQGVVFANLVRLAEWLGWMAGLFVSGSLVAVAVGGLLVRLAGLGLMVALSARGAHGIAWGVSHASVAQVRLMARPALSFMAFPLANALNFQGMTLLVGHLFGPALLALFNTYRTLTRVTMQVIAMFSHSVWPEVSRLFGQGGGSAVRRLYGRAAVFCAALSVVLSGLLFVTAPWLLKTWTHGAIELQPAFMSVMLLYALVSAASHMPRVMLLATNQHTGLAAWAVATAGLSLALTAALGDRFGLVGVGTALLVAEAALALVCVALVQRLLHAGAARAVPA